MTRFSQRDDSGPAVFYRQLAVVPFASAHALFNLSKLAVRWLRLGIGIERIKPGHPQQNGRHERMHLTLTIHCTIKPSWSHIAAASVWVRKKINFSTVLSIARGRSTAARTA